MRVAAPNFFYSLETISGSRCACTHCRSSDKDGSAAVGKEHLLKQRRGRVMRQSPPVMDVRAPEQATQWTGPVMYTAASAHFACHPKQGGIPRVRRVWKLRDARVASGRSAGLRPRLLEIADQCYAL